MKKKPKIIVISITIIILLIVLIILFLNRGLNSMKVTDFIDNYNQMLQKNISTNITIRYPNDNDRIGATYFIPITENIYLGVANNSDKPRMNLETDTILATLLRYEKNLTDYSDVNQYLFYLIKVNNSKIPNNKINEIIKELRSNPNITIKKYNLVIEHNSSDYQADSVGRVER